MNNKAIKITTLHTSISSSSHPMYSKTIFNKSKRSSINIYSLKIISVHHKLPNVVLLEHVSHDWLIELQTLETTNRCPRVKDNNQSECRTTETGIIQIFVQLSSFE